MKSRILLILSVIAIFPATIGTVWANDRQESPKKPDPITIGETLQILEFEDIDGKKGTTEDYKDWIIIYSFADRKNSKALMEWIGDAGIDVTKAHPDMKIVYINFADVTIVPYALRHLVTPILRMINRKSSKQLKETYASKGISIDSEKLRFVMIPDWTGKYLQAFRLPNAREYRSYVALEGRILAMFDAQTQNFRETFVNFFDQLIASLQSVKSSIESSAVEKSPVSAGNPPKPGATSPK